MVASRFAVGSNQYQQRLKSGSSLASETRLELRDSGSRSDSSPTMKQAEAMADHRRQPERVRAQLALSAQPSMARLVRGDPSPTVRALSAWALDSSETLDDEARFVSRILSAPPSKEPQ